MYGRQFFLCAAQTSGAECAFICAVYGSHEYSYGHPDRSDAWFYGNRTACGGYIVGQHAVAGRSGAVWRLLVDRAVPVFNHDAFLYYQYWELYTGMQRDKREKPVAASWAIPGYAKKAQLNKKY